MWRRGEGGVIVFGSTFSFLYFLSIGGNLGRAKSYTGINPGYLTGGVFNGARFYLVIIRIFII